MLFPSRIGDGKNKKAPKFFGAVFIYTSAAT
jgi:hypothetical protein